MVAEYRIDHGATAKEAIAEMKAFGNSWVEFGYRDAQKITTSGKRKPLKRILKSRSTFSFRRKNNGVCCDDKSRFRTSNRIIQDQGELNAGPQRHYPMMPVWATVTAKYLQRIDSFDVDAFGGSAPSSCWVVGNQLLMKLPGSGQSALTYVIGLQSRY